jgi:diguanylate cyclase (GGDEF)-like protein
MTFFQSQMDYILFFYGLAFLILAAISFTVRERESPLFWFLLGLFGLTHGLSEWLDLVAFALGDAPLFSAFRTLLMIVSFVFLFEFGRRSLAAVEKISVGKWIYIPISFLVFYGSREGWTGVNAMARYGLGLTGGLLSSLAIYLACWKDNEKVNRTLLAGSLALGLYTLSTGIIVPSASFFPARFINYSTFSAFFGFPVQLARGIFALCAATALWFFAQQSYSQGLEEQYRRSRKGFSIITALVTIILLAIGWGATELVGRFHETAISRLTTILEVSLLNMMTIAFFVFWQRGKDAEMKIETMALHDSLTGIANRRLMDIMLERYFAEAIRNGRPLTVIMADIDYFKRYNDTFGHQAGDSMIKETAQFLITNTRETDMVARYGGEEFIIVLPDVELVKAFGVAERIRASVDRAGKITISFGIACLKKGMLKQDELIRKADEALYEAKRSGRNRVVVADPQEIEGDIQEIIKSLKPTVSAGKPLNSSVA